MLSEYITSLADVSFHIAAYMYARFRYSGKNTMRFAVFWCIYVRFCGFRTPLTPPSTLYKSSENNVTLIRLLFLNCLPSLAGSKRTANYVTKFSVTSVNFSAELGDETSPSFKEIATSLENKVERPECHVRSCNSFWYHHYATCPGCQ